MVFSAENLQINTLISSDLKESFMTGTSSNPETDILMTVTRALLCLPVTVSAADNPVGLAYRGHIQDFDARQNRF